MTGCFHRNDWYFHHLVCRSVGSSDKAQGRSSSAATHPRWCHQVPGEAGGFLRPGGLTHSPEQDCSLCHVKCEHDSIKHSGQWAAGFLQLFLITAFFRGASFTFFPYTGIRGEGGGSVICRCFCVLYRMFSTSVDECCKFVSVLSWP